MRGFIPWEKKEDVPTAQARLLLQLSAAAVTEVMQGSAKPLCPATHGLSGHVKHKAEDICFNLSQRRKRGDVFSSGHKLLRLCRQLLFGAGQRRNSLCIGAEVSFSCSCLGVQKIPSASPSCLWRTHAAHLGGCL